ncbi:DUF6693 family protein [Desulfocurvibacter africanus]|uniref:DUF898 domain-containing protein n=1 Tax=Desulfocurvibacter africanus subsp. africanus str. Walvis Bay TaxID=690850 RepID=F3YUM5_DESAF|nr:DUF6693 family protein [Desulfocurvibacter africanus]EGJ48979.1 hypothetical protein Desaf_0626 [Desulfocurvibacter africanus subsp. africanus str. Walvis Bay]
MSKQSIAIDLSVSDALGHAVIWIFFTVITLGFAFMFYPYALARFIINKTYLKDEFGKLSSRFNCTLDFTGNLGHALLWFLLSLVTFGLAYIIYVYRVWVYALNKTSLEPIAQGTLASQYGAKA